MHADLNRANPGFPLSVLVSSLPGDFVFALRSIASLGFGFVDAVAMVDRPAEHLEALAESGLVVGCASIGRCLAEGQTLDATSLDSRRAAVDTMERHINDAARLGATSCYVVPGKDGSETGLARFREACEVLADFAGRRMLRLCVEHIPSTALARADQTLSWLRSVGNANLGVLVDVGHCLITGEDPAQIILEAGPQLGYVHLDDNDGVADLHWPLLHGRLTEAMLRSVLAAYRSAGCPGLALELRSDLENYEAVLRQGKELIERLSRDLA
jgi:sugar phosphate isomerase/epimerase